MAEYIEREAVENMLADAQIITDGEYCGYCTEDVDVSQLPAADVVEVVRCWECKHRETIDCPMCHEELYYDGEDDIDSHIVDRAVDSNGFCCAGERRESDATD